MAQVDLRYRPFLILLGLGVLVRAVLMIVYFPSVMLWVDAIRHTRIIPAEIFGDPWMPAGYAMWLAVLRGITHQLWFTIVVQHFMGLAVGPMIFLVMRRLGAMSCIACLGAAVPLLSGDHLYLEHIIMSDSVLIFLISAGLSAAVFAFVERVNLAWLCFASVFFGMATLVRNVGVILLPVLVLVTFFWCTEIDLHGESWWVLLVRCFGIGCCRLLLLCPHISTWSVFGLRNAWMESLCPRRALC